MMNSGEEAVQFGSAAGLDPDDMIYAQYRETGVFMWRGFTIDDCMDQCFGNRLEGGRGRQMPVHYGSHKLNIQFISSCLATQMPHGEREREQVGGLELRGWRRRKKEREW